MAMKISAKKGGISIGTVLAGYVVALACGAAAKAAGIDITADQQAQLTAAIVAAVTGLVTAGLNAWKHRIPKVEKQT